MSISYNATTHDDLSPTHKAKPLADLRGCTRRCGGSSSSLRITRGRCVSMHAPDHDNAPMRMHSQPRRPSSPRTMHPFGYTSSGCMSSGCSPWCLDAREPELGPAPPVREAHNTAHEVVEALVTRARRCSAASKSSEPAASRSGCRRRVGSFHCRSPHRRQSHTG